MARDEAAARQAGPSSLERIVGSGALPAVVGTGVLIALWSRERKGARGA